MQLQLLLFYTVNNGLSRRKHMKNYNAIEASQAQEGYCNEHKVPRFAPDNGWCSYCGRNIYEPYTYRGREEHTIGISVEEAGSRLITGCPHCNATFCD